MTQQSPSAYRPSCMFPTCASATVHNFFAHAADARIVLPLMAGAAIGPGAAHLPELDIDMVVDWPTILTRQAARAHSTLTGRHLILIAMRSPLVADRYEVTLVFNDAGTITFLDKLQLFTNDGCTFWLSPSDFGLLHFQLRRGGLIARTAAPWRGSQQRRAGFARAADLLTDRLLGLTK